MAISQKLKDACARLQAKAVRDIQDTRKVEIGVIDDQEIATYASYQEYGWVQRVTRKQAWWFRHQFVSMPPTAGSSLVLPPRPFLRATLHAEAEKWSRIFANAVQATGSVEQALQMVGITAVADIKTTLAAGGTKDEAFEPRAPLTMELYSSEAAGHQTDGTGNLSVTKPLVKSGALLNSIGFQLSTGSGD